MSVRGTASGPSATPGNLHLGVTVRVTGGSMYQGSIGQVVDRANTIKPIVRFDYGPVAIIPDTRLQIFKDTRAPVFGLNYVGQNLNQALGVVSEQIAQPTRVVVTEITYRQMLRDMGDSPGVEVAESVRLLGTVVRRCLPSWGINENEVLGHGVALFFDKNDQPFAELDFLNTFLKNQGVTGKAETFLSFENRLKHRLDSPEEFQEYMAARKRTARWNI